MLIDQQVGAQLHTMFMVDYQPTAIAHPHDHRSKRRTSLSKEKFTA